MHASPSHLPTLEQLRQFDKPGPRYTSYPTADRFVEAFTEHDWRLALAEQRLHHSHQPLSVYVHIPFCESVCYYCACNKIVTRQHRHATAYLRLLETELALYERELGRGRTVSQLHFGGGTPTYLSDAELGELCGMLGDLFRFSADAERSIEVDPRTIDGARLERLRALGFNRLSFGVQDFDPDVQKAVHRVQPLALVEQLLRAAGELGFAWTNVDLIHGLPLQTVESFERTLREVVRLRPSRIAMYGYAHLPERFKPQRRIDATQLPAPATRTAMLALALRLFGEAGYELIGMDHWALPDDPLAQAKRLGRLQRNFQGYSTQRDCDLIALGVSAIGRVGATYAQNAKTLEEYGDALRQDRLPIVRGLTLSRDDLLRRAVIMAIMCQGQVHFESVEAGYLIDFREYFATELQALASPQFEGLLTVDDAGITLTELGWYFVRAVAMQFDRYLTAQANRNRYSRIL